MRRAIRSLLAEPAAADQPPPRWWDWVLVAAFSASALAEGLLAPDVVWRPAAIVLALTLVWTLPWRRVEPLTVTALCFVPIAVVDVAAIVADAAFTGLNTMAYVILVIYALFRWGSGRDAATGGTLVLVAATLGAVVDPGDLAEMIGGYGFLAAIVAVAIAVRSSMVARRRQIEGITMREREQLARELHDTVAHHVSAIAIRAQAGRTAASDDSRAPLDALAVIEAEAARALAEMRSMVGVLRDDEAAELGPAPGLVELVGLADSDSVPRVEVELDGDLSDVPQPITSAVFRLAQESVTNARRHARGATVVQVTLRGSPDSLVLRVADDGDTSHLLGGVGFGYGLLGMAERARLLGGTCVAGPSPEGGWTVTATLPRSATPAARSGAL